MRVLALLPLLVLTAAAPAPGDGRGYDDRDYMVSSFERLRVDGPFDVEVVADGSPGASAEGDRRALERLNVHLDGSTLSISAGAEGWNWAPGERLEIPKIKVRAPGLHVVLVNGGGRVAVSGMRGARVDLSLNGAGTIEGSDIDADQLNATLVGGGTMRLSGKALKARLQSSGSGTLDAEGLAAGDAQVVSQSSGDTALNVRYTVQVNALGAGAVRIGGQPKCLVRGPGPVECGMQTAP